MNRSMFENVSIRQLGGIIDLLKEVGDKKVKRKKTAEEWKIESEFPGRFFFLPLVRREKSYKSFIN